MAVCPVCTKTLRLEPGRRGALNDQTFFDCDLCGQFGLTNTAVETVPASLDKEPNKRPVFSHVLREMQRGQKWPVVDSDTAKQIFRSVNLPTPKVQADKLIRWLGGNLPGPGDEFAFKDLLPRVIAIIGAASKQGLDFVVHSMIESGLLNRSPERAGLKITLSFAGWERYEELSRGSPSGNNAFMAMKFDENLRHIVDIHFRPAVQQTGFTLKLLDDEPKAGLIDDRLRVELQTARFLISDLTHDNSGAYWEAGYAEGLGKPVIYTCKRDVFEERGTHFDTNHLLTVPWSEDSLPEAMDMLKASIRATIPEARKTDE